MLYWKSFSYGTRTSVLAKTGWKLKKRGKQKLEVLSFRASFFCINSKYLPKITFLKSNQHYSAVMFSKPSLCSLMFIARLPKGLVCCQEGIFQPCSELCIPAVSPSPFTLAVALLSFCGRMAHGAKAAELPYGKVINFLLHPTFNSSMESLVLQELNCAPRRIRLEQPRQGGREIISGKCFLLKLTWWQHGVVPSSICASDLCMYKLAKNFSTLGCINCQQPW